MITFWKAIKAVLSAFIGIRNHSHAHQSEIKPHHYIIAGVTVLILFIVLLIVLINLIV